MIWITLILLLGWIDKAHSGCEFERKTNGGSPEICVEADDTVHHIKDGKVVPGLTSEMGGFCYWFWEVHLSGDHPKTGSMMLTFNFYDVNSTDPKLNVGFSYMGSTNTFLLNAYGWQAEFVFEHSRRKSYHVCFTWNPMKTAEFYAEGKLMESKPLSQTLAPPPAASSIERFYICVDRFHLYNRYLLIGDVFLDMCEPAPCGRISADFPIWCLGSAPKAGTHGSGSAYEGARKSVCPAGMSVPQIGVESLPPVPAGGAPPAPGAPSAPGAPPAPPGK